MSTPIRIAAVQMDVRLADPRHNLERMEIHLRATAADNVRLTVFPECALAGYCFDSLEEARPFAETVPGPSTESFTTLCRELGVFVAYGLLERDGPRVFNACALVGPEGLVACYRKVHLPYLGIDRFTTPGDRPFAVSEVAGLRVGMNICYDGSFPEAARVMALAGADLIILPTNWPPGSECTAACVIQARALENHIYYLAVNRVGTESGFVFIGHSKICEPGGRIMAEAAHPREAVLIAEVDPELARTKRLVRVPDKHIIDRFADRRPEMYGSLAAPRES